MGSMTQSGYTLVRDLHEWQGAMPRGARRRAIRHVDVHVWIDTAFGWRDPVVSLTSMDVEDTVAAIRAASGRAIGPVPEIAGVEVLWRATIGRGQRPRRCVEIHTPATSGYADTSFLPMAAALLRHDPEDTYEPLPHVPVHVGDVLIRHHERNDLPREMGRRFAIRRRMRMERERALISLLVHPINHEGNESDEQADR